MPSWPMLPEALGLFACLLALWLVGIGPALWLLSGMDKRVAYAAGIAPALGGAIVGLLAFPLARFAAPAQRWAVPATLALVGLSLGLALLDWRLRPGDYQGLRSRRTLWAAAAWVVVGCAVLAGPLVVRGMQYAAFRANPSDAFLQLSLSEALRVVEWHTLAAGAVMDPSNLAGLKNLAAASPTALFPARTLLLPLALSKVAATSWAAAATGLPVYRFYHVFNLLSFALSMPLVLIIGDLLKSPRLLTGLSAGAVAFGFWAKFVLDSDAGYEIAALPMLLLAVCAWMLLEQQPLRALAPARFLLAGALAVVASYYFALAPLAALAFALYYGLGLLQGVRPLAAVGWHGLTVGLALLLLALTGQIDFAARNWLYLALNAGGEARHAPYVLWLFWANDISAVWGLPATVLWSDLPLPARWTAQSLSAGLGLFLTLAAAVAAAQVARKAAPPAERVLYAVILGGAALAAAAYAADNHRAAGKAFTYMYPYLTLAAAVSARYVPRLFSGPARRAAAALPAVWLGSQCLLGVYLPYQDRVAEAQGAPAKNEAYDLASLTGYLDAHPPQRLLVNVPRAAVWPAGGVNAYNPEGWAFAYYAMSAFSAYRPYFQSGIIVDNTLQAQNLWLQKLEAPPDYAVMLREVDYVGPQGLGVKVAETADLVLYRITAEDLQAFAQAERRQFAERERATECFWEVCSPPGA